MHQRVRRWPKTPSWKGRSPRVSSGRLERWWAGSPSPRFPLPIPSGGPRPKSLGWEKPLYSQKPLEGAPTTCDAPGSGDAAPSPGSSPFLLGCPPVPQFPHCQMWMITVEPIDSMVSGTLALIVPWLLFIRSSNSYNNVWGDKCCYSHFAMGKLRLTEGLVSG